MVTSEQQGFNWNQAKLFTNLLWVNALRGNDSTGVFGVNKYGNVDYLKTVGNTAKLIEANEFKEFKDNIFSDFHMVVGHNRSATRGSITDENAHPFVEGTTILVHNGTLHNHHELTKQDVSVDSHAILHSIVERGYEETMKSIQGAFTLVWYDTKDKTLRAIRNDERPLFIASCYGSWIFASELEMIQLVLGREAAKIASVTTCAPGTMYYWELEDKKNMWYKPLPLWKPEKKPKNLFPVVYTKPEKKEPVVESDVLEYNNSDFVIGTQILININSLEEFKRKGDDNFSGMFKGTWFFEPDIKVIMWTTDLELIGVDYDPDDGIEHILSGTIQSVISKKGAITLVCNKPKKYVPTLDSNSHEIYEDEFIFTDCKCQDCKTPMSFKDAQEGAFNYVSHTEFTLFCEKCK
jgi:hypothetical protein